MSDITQISNNTNLFSQTGKKVVTVGSADQSVAADGTTKEDAEQLQQQFLQILITQMQNQNPLDPVDTTEFTNQLVQYSSLEQQIDTNLKLSSILDSLNISSSFSAFSYIGNEVEIPTNMTALQDGVADWNYSLKGDADGGVTIKVLNQSGQLVYKAEPGKQSSGSYNFSFNQDDALIPVSEGEVLYLSVSATDSADELVSMDILTNVAVDSVETDSSGNIVLRAGDLYFSVDDISKISKSNSVGNANDTNTDNEEDTVAA